MKVPDYQAIMLPLLKFASDGKEHSNREAIDYIISAFNLSDEDIEELLPSGQQRVVDNRVGWAKTHLSKAGLLEFPKRAYFIITPLGLDVLKENPPAITVKFLKKFPTFVEFITTKKGKDSDSSTEVDNNSTQTPVELLEEGFQKIKRNLTEELITTVRRSSWNFFEKLVVELLLAMGYGGSRKDAGQAIGRSGDGGIDGMIKEDKLGLDVIYIQAKKWEDPVGRPEIQKFVGSLAGERANKGVFITTSSFTREAVEFVKTITHKVILVDGEKLAQLMIENNVGVSRVISYDIKRVDTDYFVED